MNTLIFFGISLVQIASQRVLYLSEKNLLCQLFNLLKTFNLMSLKKFYLISSDDGWQAKILFMPRNNFQAEDALYFIYLTLVCVTAKEH